MTRSVNRSLFLLNGSLILNSENDFNALNLARSPDFTIWPKPGTTVAPIPGLVVNPVYVNVTSLGLVALL